MESVRKITLLERAATRWMDAESSCQKGRRGRMKPSYVPLAAVTVASTAECKNMRSVVNACTRANSILLCNIGFFFFSPLHDLVPLASNRSLELYA